MYQRRIDLMCMEIDDLNELVQRLRMLRRAAREYGAVQDVFERWDESISDVEAELKLRRDDAALPF